MRPGAVLSRVQRLGGAIGPHSVEIGGSGSQVRRQAQGSQTPQTSAPVGRLRSATPPEMAAVSQMRSAALDPIVAGAGPSRKWPLRRIPDVPTNLLEWQFGDDAAGKPGAVQGVSTAVTLVAVG